MKDELDNLCPHYCPKDQCVVCNPELADDVRWCRKCDAGTWHKDAACLKCGSISTERWLSK